jgi:integrase
MPVVLAELVEKHLIDHTGPDPLDLLFTNSRGAPVRATVWTAAWSGAQRHAHVDTRLHDLRHLAGTLTAQAGATLKETMDRLGHTTPNAALRYQHVAAERAVQIASGIDSIVRP